jgi:translation initiation factor 2B subunit (eIF-2B alpha/beta/delta family)
VDPPDDDEAALPGPLRAAIARVRANRTDGASRLARDVAATLADASAAAHADADDDVSRLHDLHHMARAFAAARPSMAAVANTAASIWYAGVSATANGPSARLGALHARALAALQEFDSSAGAIFEHARPLLSGELYTFSRSGTVESMLTRLARWRRERHEPTRIVVSESRPGGEGVDTARALAAAGWEVTFVPDSVRSDGSVVNKVGSSPLALMAHEVRVPVYVLCEVIKIASPDFPLRFEEMDPRGLLPDPPPGITARNVYFDRTPAELVTEVVTEVGPLSRDDIARIAQEARLALASLAAPDDA